MSLSPKTCTAAIRLVLVLLVLVCLVQNNRIKQTQNNRTKQIQKDRTKQTQNDRTKQTQNNRTKQLNLKPISVLHVTYQQF